MMKWIKDARATYILNKFCGAYLDSDIARITDLCASNIDCFDIHHLTKLWECLVFFWVSKTGYKWVVEVKLKPSLENRGTDVLQSFYHYYKGRSYNVNSFAFYKHFLLANFLALDKVLAHQVRETFDGLFSPKLLIRPTNVFKLHELAYIASSIITVDTNVDLYIIMDYMRELTGSS